MITFNDNDTVTDAVGHTFTIGYLGKYYYMMSNRDGCPQMVDAVVHRRLLYQCCAAVEVFAGREPMVVRVSKDRYRVSLTAVSNDGILQ